MRELEKKQTVLKCMCGQKHSVPAVLLVRDANELERENMMLRASLFRLRNQMKKILEEEGV